MIGIRTRGIVINSFHQKRDNSIFKSDLVRFSTRGIVINSFHQKRDNSIFKSDLVRFSTVPDPVRFHNLPAKCANIFDRIHHID